MILAHAEVERNTKIAMVQIPKKILPGSLIRFGDFFYPLIASEQCDKGISGILLLAFSLTKDIVPHVRDVKAPK